jgi:hypothetical protein
MFEYNITTSLTYHYCFIEVPVSREKSDWSCACVLRIVMLENLVGQGNHACSNSNACYDFCIKTMFGSS